MVSKVPMQPRREREPLVAETVFHVTKSGDSVISVARWELFAGERPMGVNAEVLEEGVVSAVEVGSGESELLVLEPEPGVEDREPEIRASVGFLALDLSSFRRFLKGLLDTGGSGIVPDARFSRSSSEEAKRSSSKPFG